MRLTEGQALRAVAALLFLGGCDGDRPRPAPKAAAITAPADAAAEPRADGPVKIVIDNEPAHLNPDLDPDVWAWRLSHDAIYEPLIRARGDGTWEPVLADRFSVDDGGNRLTIHLRPGVLWHDEKPFSAADVLATLDRIRGPHAPARARGLLADVSSIELGANDTIRIWAAHPSVALPEALAEIAILPEHVFGHGELAYQGGNRRPVGTGPFRLREWEHGRKIVLGRFDKYWGGPNTVAEEIDVAIEPDAARALGQARRGEIDLLGRVPPAWYPEQLESPTLRSAFRTMRATPARFTFVLWNLEHPPFSDPAVRRALNQAIDRTRLANEVRHGVARPIVAPILDGATGPEPIFDLAAAQAALDAAGLPRGSEGGPRTRNGHPLRIGLLVPSGSHESSEAARLFVDALAKIGIAVEISVGDLPILLMRLRKGMFDAVLLEWNGRDDDDLSPLFHTGGAQNFGKYSVREVDRALEATRDPTISSDERHARFGRLASALAADPPALFLYAPDEIYLLGKRLGDPRPDGDFVLIRDLGAPR
jgi:peptide/nickel transport system substrate-binding protein